MHPVFFWFYRWPFPYFHFLPASLSCLSPSNAPPPLRRQSAAERSNSAFSTRLSYSRPLKAAGNNCGGAARPTLIEQRIMSTKGSAHTPRQAGGYNRAGLRTTHGVSGVLGGHRSPPHPPQLPPHQPHPQPAHPPNFHHHECRAVGLETAAFFWVRATRLVCVMGHSRELCGLL